MDLNMGESSLPAGLKGWPSLGITEIIRGAIEDELRPDLVSAARDIISELVMKAPAGVRSVISDSSGKKAKERQYESEAIDILMEGLRSANSELVKRFLFHLSDIEMEKAKTFYQGLLSAHFNLSPRERHLRELELIRRSLTPKWVQLNREVLEPKLDALVEISDLLLGDLQWTCQYVHMNNDAASFRERMAMLFHEVIRK